MTTPGKRPLGDAIVDTAILAVIGLTGAALAVPIIVGCCAYGAARYAWRRLLGGSP